ncbi:hypothetical protein [Tsuneonella deserti]|nr:hypothetical protein [Tsuneonella deserti]
MAEPLKRPGEVIMKSRGGLADQLKALGPRRKPTAMAGKEKPKPKKGKPPKRSRLDAADAALADAEKRQAAERAELEKQRDAIERKLSSLRTKHEKEVRRLKERRDTARDAYRDALDRWSE